ncbi:hypothetical protein LEP1GSC021_0102 [Leptospira noguchii str. 1993005606]|uniref:Uncharacterized protein n=1 Tax=Leptospira noguchii str. 2001034031 TaxID=1193053 RepID=M6YL37_9LEPT|nr:hypothetical protein [Leptospira noguchii]EMO90324.1 hypothetical protein LEP1GSC024_4171 [Leptospira noguchii str. 2001034031]EPE85138.1 hypothetical protein LEP1GSC021_0102 [Leptospira noguchii str. 1993005606]
MWAQEKAISFPTDAKLYHTSRVFYTKETGEGTEPCSLIFLIK